MNRGQFLKLIRHPGSVNKQALQAIDRLLHRYPYFQGARVLSALSKHRMRQLDARKNIHLASLYTTDKQLFKDFMAQKSSVAKGASSNRPNPSSATSGIKKRTATKSIGTKKPNYVVPTLSEEARKKLVDSVMHELDNLKHNMSNFTQAEQTRTFRSEETRRKRSEDQQAKAQLEAERHRLAEEQKRLEAQQAKSQLETERNKLSEEQKRLEAQQAKSQLETERNKLSEEQKRLEAQQAAEAQQAKSQLETERNKLSEEQKRLEAQQAKAQLEAERHRLAAEQKRLEAQQAKAQLEAERHRLAEEQKRLEAQKAIEINQRFEEKVKALEAQLETERQKIIAEQKRLEAQQASEINQRIEEKIRTLENRTQAHKVPFASSSTPSSSPELRYTAAQSNVPPPYAYNNYSPALPAPYPTNYPYVAPMQAYPFSAYFHPQFSMPTPSHMPTYGLSSSPFQFSHVFPQSTPAVPTHTSAPFNTPPAQMMMMPSASVPSIPTPAPLPPPLPPAEPLPSRNQHAAIDHFIDSLSKDKNKPPSSALSSSDTINDDICSEELAQLYHNQGHLERSIEIYHRLCDRYPEKSQYFLQKIKDIRKT